MNIDRTFRNFLEKIRLSSLDKFIGSVNEITKKLNKRYYDSKSEKDHCVLVGSIGRETAVSNVSDVDLIFSLPWEVHRRFDSYEGNGQSALLQEIRNELLQRYPSTEIKGDGQVVDVIFEDYTIEVVPGFLKSDGSYEYPDSNDGGKWRTTNPIPEQNAVEDINEDSGGIMHRVCCMLRIWKNHMGFVFGGLLIDTLVNDFLLEHKEYWNGHYAESVELLKGIFAYLSKQDPEQKYWYALGSNQQVDNSGQGAFVRRAKKAVFKLESAKDDDALEETLSNIFGQTFESCVEEDSCAKDRSTVRRFDRRSPFEDFISEKFPVDIQYKLKIDCSVTQPGYRSYWLSELLKVLGRNLSKNKKLNFKIVATSVPKPYSVYWKVRNRGPLASGRERGQIFKGYITREEHTNFTGPHYVECYLVKNGICVARDHIDVPINIARADDSNRLE